MKQVVVQFPAGLFSAGLLARSELGAVRKLLQRATTGLVFTAEVRSRLGPQVQHLLTLAPWGRLVEAARYFTGVSPDPSLHRAARLLAGGCCLPRRPAAFNSA